jgi:hypothetical protein
MVKVALRDYTRYDWGSEFHVFSTIRVIADVSMVF